MAEILHRLIGSISHYLQSYIHPKWLFGIQPSTVSPTIVLEFAGLYCFALTTGEARHTTRSRVIFSDKGRERYKNGSFEGHVRLKVLKRFFISSQSPNHQFFQQKTSKMFNTNQSMLVLEVVRLDIKTYIDRPAGPQLLVHHCHLNFKIFHFQNNMPSIRTFRSAKRSKLARCTMDVVLEILAPRASTVPIKSSRDLGLVERKCPGVE